MMNAQRLSPLNQHLVTELRNDATLAAERFDLRHESVPPFLYGYPYEVSAWPIFVNGRFIREQIEPLLVPMPRILYQSLSARFSDSTAMAEYFGWPELICEMFAQAPVDPRDLLIRYDAVLDDNGLKLIENNFGSSAGGWQSDYFQPQMRTRLSRLEQSQAKNFRYRFILPAMLKTLAAGICRRKPAGAAGNLLVYHTFSPGGPNLANFHDSLQSVYDAVKPPAIAGGRVTILRSFDDIGFTSAGEVFVDGKIMDAFIMGDALYTDIPQAMLNRLIAAHLRDQLVFPDSPFHLLLGDKGVLALMHECVSARLLDPADCALIKRYVPWTARLLDQEVLLEGVHVPLVQHLLAHKDDFVIKKFHSSSGRDVVVGRHVDADTWGTMIRAYAETRAPWIVQQFCTPSLLDLHDAALGVVPHKLIWGIFSYGGEYAGAFVRTDRGVELQGVINSATGATELPVFEVD